MNPSTCLKLLSACFLGCVLSLPVSAFEQKLVVPFTGTSGKYRGITPLGKLADDGKGYLWGVTRSGGKFNLGTVFKIRRSDGAFTTVKDLNGKVVSPMSGLVRVGDYMWGVTPGENNFGMPNITGCGAIYKISISKHKFTTVFQFGGGGKTGITAVGCNPAGTLVKDKTGKLWGVASGGSGSTRFGTVFRLNPKTGSVEKIVAFTGKTGSRRGSYPVAGLTADQYGTLWGITNIGGASDLGTIFRVNPNTKAFKTAVEFGGSKIGENPQAKLLWDPSNKIFWGTTGAWPYSNGTVFWYEPGKSRFGHYFAFSDYSRESFPGSTPNELVRDTKGNIWGTTHTGGHPDFVPWHGYGCLYRIDLVENSVNYEMYFLNAATGVFPTGGLTVAPDGKLWGVTEQGGADNFGAVYSIKP